MNNKINYSENSNGMFINLSLLDDDLIDILYQKVLDLSKINEKEISSIKKEPVIEKKNIKEEKNEIVKDDLTMNSLERKMIELSKQ